MSKNKRKHLLVAHHVATWDCKEHPDIDDINEGLKKVPRPRLFLVDTQSDEFGIVIAPNGTTQQQAQKMYEEDSVPTG